MAKEKSPLDPEVVIPKVQGAASALFKFLGQRKKLVVAAVVILLVLFAFNSLRTKKVTKAPAKTVSVKVDKSWDMTALSNQGKVASTKIRLKVTTAEKTNQVLVKDQVYTATNKKMFLILNLELKNDATAPLNILPGDLVRMTYGGDQENKFAPDLHNNLVLVAAISTKTDRVGFVIPEEARDFKLYVGELDGKKDVVEVHFPS